MFIIYCISEFEVWNGDLQPTEKDLALGNVETVTCVVWVSIAGHWKLSPYLSVCVALPTVPTRMVGGTENLCPSKPKLECWQGYSLSEKDLEKLCPSAQGSKAGNLSLTRALGWKMNKTNSREAEMPSLHFIVMLKIKFMLLVSAGFLKWWVHIKNVF